MLPTPTSPAAEEEEANQRTAMLCYEEVYTLGDGFFHEWQRGIRAVQNSPNILVETSGFDASAGFIEMAVRELGARRIVFGSHLPSRSLGTELSKVIAANIPETDKRLILGENFRKLIQRPIA